MKIVRYKKDDGPYKAGELAILYNKEPKRAFKHLTEIYPHFTIFSQGYSKICSYTEELGSSFSEYLEIVEDLNGI